MVVPTPGRPKLDEMPRDFFNELAVFTILEPMDLSKYKQIMLSKASGFGGPRGGAPAAAKKLAVKVLETGVVGSLEYKILEAKRADDLYEWLKDNKYSYS